VEQDRNPNAPTERQRILRIPERRHYAIRLSARSVRHTNENTVIMPWVDVPADRQAILDGLAQRDGNTFTVHGRTYGWEPNGRLYPREGDGFHRLSRGAYRALSLYNDEKLRMAPEQMLDLERVPEADREMARRLKHEIEEWQRGQ
jgi:hypothetical protein